MINHSGSVPLCDDTQSIFFAWIKSTIYQNHKTLTLCPTGSHFYGIMMIKWCTIKLFSSGPHGSECRFKPPPPECVFTRLDLSAEESWAPLELVWDCGSKGLQAGVAAPPRRSSTSARHPPTWLPQPSAAYENSRPCFSFFLVVHCSSHGLSHWARSLHPHWWSKALIGPLDGETTRAFFCDVDHDVCCLTA